MADPPDPSPCLHGDSRDRRRVKARPAVFPISKIIRAPLSFPTMVGVGITVAGSRIIAEWRRRRSAELVEPEVPLQAWEDEGGALPAGK
jgi:hypothetical protein